MSEHTLVRATAVGLTLAVLTACDGRGPSAMTDTETSVAVALDTHGGAEYRDVMAQGGGSVYAENGSRLVRQSRGFQAGMTVPTPEPGTYVYPAGIEPGDPEVFTLWAFVFNNPENCTAPCNGDDLGTATGADGGAYNLGGHVASGRSLTIAGRIATGETPFLGAPLARPGHAEIHLALTSHGGMDPATFPNEFRIPTGNGLCGCWWVSIFE